MLTGPVTMLQWSFVRDDQPRSETCEQLALAIRDEVADLEAAGIEIIQVDEPAIREGLPLRRDRWDEYLEWAVYCFRVATAVVRDETQIQTHMCYSDFGDIMEQIQADGRRRAADRGGALADGAAPRLGAHRLRATRSAPASTTSTRRASRPTEEMVELLQARRAGARARAALGQPRLRPEDPRLATRSSRAAQHGAGREAAARRARSGRLTRGRVGSAKNWHRGGRPGVPSVGAAPPLPEPAVRFDRWLPPVRADISVCRHQVESATRPRLRCA